MQELTGPVPGGNTQHAVGCQSLQERGLLLVALTTHKHGDGLYWYPLQAFTTQGRGSD